MYGKFLFSLIEDGLKKLNPLNPPKNRMPFLFLNAELLLKS